MDIMFSIGMDGNGNIGLFIPDDNEPVAEAVLADDSDEAFLNAVANLAATYVENMN